MPACRNSVFLVNDDEGGLHYDYEVWFEELAPHAPIDQAGPEAAGPGTGGTIARARPVPSAAKGTT